MVCLLLALSFFFQENTWDVLATTDVEIGTDPFLNEAIELPVFSEQVKALDGTEITLEGFVIPLQQQVDQRYFVLSRFPFQSCFFCGAAGPETVAEVYADEEFRYTDEQVRVTGTLELNADNPIRLFFILRNCEVTRL